MTLEKRLDQLEPVVAEVLAQLDRVTAQNRTLTIVVGQNTEAIISQSDNIQFLLREVADLKTETNRRFDAVDAKFDAINNKVDLILQILQSGNRRN